MKTVIVPVFRLRRGIGYVGVWSPSSSFSATLLGIVTADVTYPDEISFDVDELLLERFERRELIPALDLDLKTGWAVDYRSGPQPECLLDEFKQEYCREWKRIEKVSEWLLSLPVSSLLETGLSSEMWTKVKV